MLQKSASVRQSHKLRRNRDTDNFDGGVIDVTYGQISLRHSKAAASGTSKRTLGCGAVNLWYKGDTVNFATHSDGYPTPQHTQCGRLHKFGTIWTLVSWAKADFTLAYGGEKGDVLAEAFRGPPVYKRAFDQDTISPTFLSMSWDTCWG